MKTEEALQKLSDFFMEKVLDSLASEKELQRKVWAVPLFFVSRKLFFLLSETEKVQRAARVCRRAGLACELLNFKEASKRWEMRLGAHHGRRYEKRGISTIARR